MTKENSRRHNNRRTHSQPLYPHGLIGVSPDVVVCFLSHCWPTTSPALSTVAAGQAGNDNIDHCDHTADDGMTDGADGIDDGHKTATDGAEDALDLEVGMLVEFSWKADAVHIRKRRRHPYWRWRAFLGVCIKVLIYFGLEVRVDSELEEACVWTVGSLKGCILKIMK